MQKGGNIMDKKVEKVFTLIYNNDMLKEGLIKKQTIDEMYEYCTSISGGYTKEEFRKFIDEMYQYVKEKLINKNLSISDEDIKKISGGLQLNNKAISSLLAAITVSTPFVGAAGADNHQKNYNVPEENKTSIVQKIKNFIFRHPLLSATGAASIPITVILGIMLRSKHKKQDTPKQEEPAKEEEIPVKEEEQSTAEEEISEEDKEEGILEVAKDPLAAEEEISEVAKDSLAAEEEEISEEKRRDLGCLREAFELNVQNFSECEEQVMQHVGEDGSYSERVRASFQQMESYFLVLQKNIADEEKILESLRDCRAADGFIKLHRDHKTTVDKLDERYGAVLDKLQNIVNKKK